MFAFEALGCRQTLVLLLHKSLVSIVPRKKFVPASPLGPPLPVHAHLVYERLLFVLMLTIPIGGIDLTRALQPPFSHYGRSGRLGWGCSITPPHLPQIIRPLGFP